MISIAQNNFREQATKVQTPRREPTPAASDESGKSRTEKRGFAQSGDILTPRTFDEIVFSLSSTQRGLTARLDEDPAVLVKRVRDILRDEGVIHYTYVLSLPNELRQEVALAACAELLAKEEFAKNWSAEEIFMFFNLADHEKLLQEYLDSKFPGIDLKAVLKQFTFYEKKEPVDFEVFPRRYGIRERIQELMSGDEKSGQQAA